MQYDYEAIKRCREYYIKFNADPTKIERAMKQHYQSWTRKNLFDSGEGKTARTGWINRFGFERSLQESLNTNVHAVQNDDQRRYAAVVKMADEYQEKALQGIEKSVPIFLKLVDQQIALRTKLDLGAANLESFVEAYELIVEWSKEIDIKLAKLFYRHQQEFIRRARGKYDGGEQEK